MTLPVVTVIKPPVCLALPGAGTSLGVVAGACEVLAERFSFAALGGTSGGGLVALALASGMSPKAVSELLNGDDGMLQRKDLLDKGWPFDNSPGLFRGKRIEALLKEVFSRHAGSNGGRAVPLKMGELKVPARVCVVDLWAREPAIIDSVEHADVEVWRAARATMAIEFFFDPIQIRTDNARTYGDGGLALNVPAGLWDDKVPPTIAMRFDAQHAELNLARLIEQGNGKRVGRKPVESVRTWPDLVTACFDVSMGVAAVTLPSLKSKDNFAEVTLKSKGDSMKFGLSKSECEARRSEGIASAESARVAHLYR